MRSNDTKITIRTVPSTTAAIVASMPAQSWYEVPNSNVSALNPCPGDNCVYSGAQGQKHLMLGWSGASFDRQRERLLPWGGGHSGYAGNEIYAFSMHTLTWARLTDPSTNIDDGVPNNHANAYPDGEPRSRHTYSYVEYIDSIDSVVSFGGSGPWKNGGGGFTNVMSRFDCSSNSWSYELGDTPGDGSRISAIAGYNYVTDKAYYSGTNSGGRLSEYDVTSGVWNPTKFIGSVQIDTTTAVDTTRNQMISIGDYQGSQEFVLYDLSTPGSTRTRPVTTGPRTVQSTGAPGLAYDPVTDQYVGWSSGSDVYTLNPDTWHWTQITAANGVTPTAPNANGTYTRFRYSPTYNCFVLVNTTTDNVYLYKLA